MQQTNTFNITGNRSAWLLVAAIAVGTIGMLSNWNSVSLANQMQATASAVQTMQFQQLEWMRDRIQLSEKEINGLRDRVFILERIQNNDFKRLIAEFEATMQRAKELQGQQQER